MGGVPCIRDLRVTVSMVRSQLAGRKTVDGVLDEYLYLERDDIRVALEYATAGRQVGLGSSAAATTGEPGRTG